MNYAVYSNDEQRIGKCFVCFAIVNLLYFHILHYRKLTALNCNLQLEIPTYTRYCRRVPEAQLDEKGFKCWQRTGDPTSVTGV